MVHSLFDEIYKKKKKWKSKKTKNEIKEIIENKIIEKNEENKKKE